ncbi:aldehyde dehydrogenase [Croceicoccus bisphenolivorans]|uniref:aldehyde dehydrogenase n=1 Tax=Croceicoccus bisphenolivorans TaxID=1783232 RepID=UPI000832606B|nr:aldehyde dehydrogenase [Croceicoccus bisphenolivorans]
MAAEKIIGHASAVRSRGLFIDGREMARPACETIAVLSPKDGTTIAHTLNCGEAEVDMAVRSAQRAFRDPDWANMSNRTRAKLVLKIADALERNMDELYELETLNNGRPYRETRAQLSLMADIYRYYAGLMIAKRDPLIPVDGPYHAFAKRVPVGVVANISPFNHPVLIASRNLAPTLASGCTTVLKPSELTPLTAIRLWEIMHEAGLPPGVFNLVTGDGANAGRALVGHPGINKLALTGGTESGRLAAQAAARNFTHTTLELGGLTPVLTFDDFDIERAVDYAAFGSFIGAGQTCVCASRHIVQRTIYDKFVERFAAKAKSIRVGDPTDPRTQMGPMISARQRQIVLDYVKIGRDEGARLVAGGNVPSQLADSGGFYMEPTIFADVSPEMRIAQDEVFGPYTVVIPFDDEEEAIAIANNSRFALAAAVRTNDLTRAHRIVDRLEAGVIWVNDHHRADASFPWGGFKDSGLMREGGQESFDYYFTTKAVMINKSSDRFDWFEPEMRDMRMN